MTLIRAGAAVLNQTPLDWDGNSQRIEQALQQAREQGCSMLCLPELCITGYGCEDMFHAPGVHDTAMEVLAHLLPQTRGMVVTFGVPILHHNALYDAVAVAVNGELAGIVAKQYLAGDGIHYEPRWFKAWPEGHRALIRVLGRDVPIGDLHFVVGGVKIGLEICEDAWVARRPGIALALQGIDVILNPSASHFAFHKIDVRRRFVLEGSRAFSTSYVYANLLGNEAGRAIYDGGALLASAGQLIAEGQRFSFQEVQVTSAVIDVATTRMIQARTGSFRPVVVEDTRGFVRRPFDWPAVQPVESPPHLDEWELSHWRKEEEFARAEALALFDYLRKSRSRGFAVSLSGGADSSACAVLVALMVRLAVQELGLEAFRRRLGHIDALADARTVEALTWRLLTCVYQKTRNSGRVTEDAARGLGEAIGAQFLLLDVDGLVDGYRERIEQALQRPLSWETDDIALQNIQARARAPSIWMLANIRGALLLSTSNRSEAAVGYATMDGDTAGGLSPIAGIDKAFLRKWLKWMEERGLGALGPLPALAAINEQTPTAELRPPDQRQTDEADLMPYDLLDAVERAAIRDKKMPIDVFERMRARFPRFTPAQLGVWIERFFQLWCRNQWKRERYAPSFHLDDENLDPKTWCRFPILSGSFTRELAALREHVARTKSPVAADEMAQEEEADSKKPPM